MLSKEQVIEIMNSMMLMENDSNKKNKYQVMIAKIKSISDEEFTNLAQNTLDENFGESEFSSWLMNKVNSQEEHRDDFIELNEFVSYSVPRANSKTLALHVVPKHVNNRQIRNGGSYLVEALDMIRERMIDGEFANIESIFAVSDILKIKRLQEDFKSLGFDVKEGEEYFRGRFKNPYQAELSREDFLSDEWINKRNEYMKKRASAKELRSGELR